MPLPILPVPFTVPTVTSLPPVAAPFPSIDGVQRHQIQSALAGAFRQMTGAPGRALPDVARAAADFFARPLSPGARHHKDQQDVLHPKVRRMNPPN